MKVTLKITAAYSLKAERQIDDAKIKELVPKMTLRRRLTRNAKIAVALADGVGLEQERIIYGSAYGEIIASTNILNSFYHHEIGSPTEFQNSVYNTPVSYLSILLDNKREIVTISSGLYTSYNVLKCAAMKGLDGDTLVLLATEALDVGVASNLGDGVDFLECGVALKCTVTEEKADFALNDEVVRDDVCGVPESMKHMFFVAERFALGQKIVEITL